MEYHHTITSELSQMEIRLTEMEEKIDSIDKKLNQVIDAILGNSLTKTGGFVEDIKALKDRIDSLEKKQEKYEDFKKRLVWTFGILVAIIIGIQYAINIYSNLK